MSRLAGKVGIITGAASGIGAVVAEAAAREGASVVVADVDGDAAERQAELIRSRGGTAAGVTVDIGDENSVQELIARTLTLYGQLDFVNNNAAATRLAGSVDVAVHRADALIWEQTMRINVIGTMLVIKHALAHMLERGQGAIINTSSGAALAGDLGHPAYGASKAAIITLTEYVATEYGKQGIRCNAIAPGLILTAAAQEAFTGPAAEMMLRHHLTPRLGTPEDVAAAVLFLASDESAFVTGHVLRVDGGLLAHQPYVADMRAAQGNLSTHAPDPAV